ncbi:MAG TPA: DHA2 family efflux MFS transporter permease subunit [Candidatus Binataceae bacterium]|nr:DHA2 family efflux MFS transporter permease subunit [Candidatus Binataceae bacterium]
MSAASIAAELSADRAWRPSHNQWVVAMTVTMATFMEVLDTSIANVALPHIAGGLSAGVDESTWVLTSYLVSNAIVLPISGWLAGMFGRKRFYMGCVALFTLSSFLCGLAPSLAMLVALRVVQGAGGGGLGPSEQAILADTFAPEERGMAFAVYGMAVVLAPAIGPTLGGWITDNFTWRWIFFINVPVGLISLALSYRVVEDPPYVIREVKERAGKMRIDYIGLGLIAVGLGFLQVVLDKGQRDDWFQSQLIATLAIAGALAVIAFIAWELRAEHPVIDLRLFKDRNFAVSALMMFTLGIVLFGTTVLLPEYVQELMGYTAQQAGMVLTPGGFAMMVTMPIVGALVSRVDGRWLLTFGFLLTGFAMLHMTGIYPGMDFRTAMLYRIYQSIGLGFLFIPITTMSYAGMRQDQNNDISAVMNFARNIGGSLGISMVTTILARRSQFHQTALVARATPMNSTLNSQLTGLGHQLFLSGSGNVDNRALGMIYGRILQQASAQAYIDVVWLLGIITLCMLPTVLLMRKGTIGAGSPAMH